MYAPPSFGEVTNQIGNANKPNLASPDIAFATRTACIPQYMSNTPRPDSKPRPPFANEAKASDDAVIANLDIPMFAAISSCSAHTRSADTSTDTQVYALIGAHRACVVSSDFAAVVKQFRKQISFG